MGWTAYYQVVRDRPLDDDELANLAKLVRAEQAEAWDGETFSLAVATSPHPGHIVAKGWQKLPMDEGSPDPSRLCNALDRLEAAVPGGTVNVSDDFGVFARGPDGFTLAGGTRRELVDDTGGAWESVLTLVPVEHAYPPAIAAALARLQASGLTDADRTDETLVAAALEQLSTPEVKPEPLKTLLAACDPDTVARTGLAHYTTYDGYEARAALSSAFGAARDVPALASAFVAAWSKPKGTYFYGDFPLWGEFGIAIARQPAVRDRFIADLDEIESGASDDELARRRCARAAVLLGGSRDPRALRRLADTVKRCRGQSQPHDLRYYLYLPALEGLGAAGDPAWLATGLLALDGSDAASRGEANVIEQSLVANAELAAPVVRVLLAGGIAIRPALSAIERAGTAAASFADAVEPYLQHPLPGIRYQARATMAALRGVERERIDDDELRDPETNMLHADLETRHAAQRKISERKDKSLVLALAIAERVDAHLRAVSGYPGLPFSWWDWQGVLPKKVIEMRGPEQIAWMRGEGASEIGPQRIPGAVAAIADTPAKDVAATYPSPFIRFDDATRAKLAALEDRAFSS